MYLNSTSFDVYVRDKLDIKPRNITVLWFF